MGRYSTRLAIPYVDHLALRPKQRILDVGCGTGALTVALVDAVGADSVSGVDPSRPYLAACRERCPGVDIREAPAEALPYGDSTFDVICSQLVIHFFADANQAVREMRRVCRPGGPVTTVAWDLTGGMELLREFWAAAHAADPNLQRTGSYQERSFGRQEELVDQWQAVGLEAIDVSGIVVSVPYRDFDDLWGSVLLGVGPLGSYIAAIEDDQREKVRGEFGGRLGWPSAGFELSARAWCVTGRKPIAP